MELLKNADRRGFDLLGWSCLRWGNICQSYASISMNIWSGAETKRANWIYTKKWSRIYASLRSGLHTKFGRGFNKDRARIKQRLGEEWRKIEWRFGEEWTKFEWRLSEELNEELSEELSKNWPDIEKKY